eukprot:1160564-Pelagomonas_calceolata.AAC.5
MRSHTCSLAQSHSVGGRARSLVDNNVTQRGRTPISLHKVFQWEGTPAPLHEVTQWEGTPTPEGMPTPTHKVPQWDVEMTSTNGFINELEQAQKLSSMLDKSSEV